MSNKYLEVLTQIVRYPRHVVQDSGEVTITIERAQPLTESSVAPYVLDLSRGGCRLRWVHALEKNEPIVLRITDSSNGISLQVPGTIRWTRGVEDEMFEAGCQFDQEIDYEHLGELFMAGFLSTETVSS